MGYTVMAHEQNSITKKENMSPRKFDLPAISIQDESDRRGGDRKDAKRRPGGRKGS